MMVKIKRRVIIQLKKNVSDPVGETLVRTFNKHNFTSTSSIRTGKVFDIELASDDKSKEELEEELKKMCDEVLCHPVMEDYSIIELEE